MKVTTNEVIELNVVASAWESVREFFGGITLIGLRVAAFQMTIFVMVCGVFEIITDVWTQAKDVAFREYDLIVETAVAMEAPKRGWSLNGEMSFEPTLTRDEIIEREAKTNKVHPDLIRAIIGKESGGNPWVMGEDATPTTGARGLMQVVCSNVKAAGLKNCNEALDEETNIRLGSWVLGSNMRQTGEDPYKALVVYRVGPKLTSTKCDTACAERYAKDVMIRFATREFNKTFIKERS